MYSATNDNKTDRISTPANALWGAASLRPCLRDSSSMGAFSSNYTASY